MAEHRGFHACKDRQLLLVPYYVSLQGLQHGVFFLHVISLCAHCSSKVVSLHILLECFAVPAGAVGAQS